MGTGVFKRGVASILLVFSLVFSMITFTPLASSGDWVNRPAPGGEIIEVVRGDNFLIRHTLEWDVLEDGAYTITMAWDCYDNEPSENFTFLGAEAYFDNNNDNLPDSGLDPILAVVTLGSAPSPDYPGSTRYALSVKCPAGNRDNRNGQFNVDITLGAYGAGGVPHIPTDNHPILEQFGGVIIFESGLDFWNRAPITISIQALPEWQLIETWDNGAVGSPAQWQLIETWAGRIEFPAQWDLVETWAGAVETPAEWQIVETWTGIIEAPAAWQLIGTWTGTIQALIGWNLIETWAATLQALIGWQTIETWRGTVQAPVIVEWELIETLTGIIEAPANWELMETWNGIIQAPTEWQLIETWGGAVESPAQWQLVETWTGTVEAPAAWQLVETWTGILEAPAAWQLIGTWTGTIRAPIGWNLTETWAGTIQAQIGWQTIETWSGTVQAPVIVKWEIIETWTGSIEVPAGWTLMESRSGIIEAPANWELMETWIGIIRAPTEWQLIETWEGAVGSPAQWQLIEMWTGSSETHFAVEWQLIETWTGTIEVPAVWELIETWTGTIEVPPEWQLIETWTGTVEAPAAWQLVETWTGTVEAPAEWQLIETWAGAVKAHTEWQLIETWTSTIEAPALPGKPVLVSPENATRTDNTPTFAWIIGFNADNHRLLVDNDSDFSSPNNVLLGASDSTWTKSAPGYSEDNYSWKVVAINALGENESAVWSFEVDAQAPPAPTLSSPSDGATTDDTTPTFDWSDVTDPSGVTYTLEIIGTLTKTGLTTSTYTLTGGEALSDGNYSWRVRAIDNVGNESDWSDTRSLTVSTTPPGGGGGGGGGGPEVDEVPPPVPSLLSPANAENITDNTPSLDWSGVSDPSGVTYDLTIARDAGFTSIVLQENNLTTSAYELTSDEALAVDIYYWRVRGVDGAGNDSSWSENWSFTYTEIPTELIENESPPTDIPSITTDENATIEVENTAITGMTIDVGENVENVRITVQQLTDKPAEIAIGAPGVTYTYLNIVSENITDADIDIVLINFRVEKAWITAEDIDPDSIVMLRWDSVAEVWVSLPTTRIGEDNTYYYYQAESPGLSIFGIGYAVAPAPAEFEFSNLVIEPSEVRAGRTVTISVVVAHVGGLGSYNVILKIDNVVESAESVTLAGVATETVTFTVSSDAEGTHDIEVEGLAGTFVVTPSASSPIVPLTITGGIVLLAGIFIWLRRRRTPIAGGYPSTNGAS